METILLKDKDIIPTDEVLKEVMGANFRIFDEIRSTLINAPFDLTFPWNYYNDGKTWFCKVSHKKKTIFWLSVWDKYFKTSFYFTEKTAPGVFDLDIAENIKNEFKESKLAGRLIPLIINVDNQDQIKDILKIAEYKKSLK